MSGSSKKLLQAAAGTLASSGGPLYVEDVFSTYLYTGTGAAQTLTNGIDLDGEGGLVWIKKRNNTLKHLLYDTNRGIYKDLNSDDTSAEDSAGGNLTAFNSNGFSIGSGAEVSNNNDTYASWTFRKAEKFFDVVEFEAPTSASDNFRVSHNLGSVPACIIVKSVDATGDWYVYHSSLETPRNDSLKLNTTAAFVASGDFWGEANPTTTDFGVQVRNFGKRPVTTSAGTYIAYLFASNAGGFGDDEDENIIKCGSFTGVGQTNVGFEPQFLLYKPRSQTANWELADNMRRLDGVSSSVLKLQPNAEDAEAGGSEIKINATGFYNGTFGSSYPCIYIAIRRPMKTPEAGTEVFAAPEYTGNGSAGNKITSNINMASGSMALFSNTDASGNFRRLYDSLRGPGRFYYTNEPRAEATDSTGLVEFLQDGVTVNADSNVNGSGSTYSMFSFKRATGFMDVVCYTGTGSAGLQVSHNLTVAPELLIIKHRNAAGEWDVYNAASGNTKYLELNSTAAAASGAHFNNTTPTSTNFTVNDFGNVNASGGTYTAYLFATLAGVSKVGSYTGTGADLNVDCGFSAGARFILIKRTDSAGDWYTYDSVRGIVAGNDPYLLLNDTDADVTNTDFIDPLNAGFTATSNGSSTVNVDGGTYIFLAIA